MQNVKPRVTIHMAASLDGFIARRDGGVDWLETSDNFEGGATMTPETVEGFLKTISCYVMGSRTYETALDFEAKGWVVVRRQADCRPDSSHAAEDQEQHRVLLGRSRPPGGREIEAELPQHLVRRRW